ncbi:MAG: uroporphyrinogen decarboxylase family protein [FCB group bacterium]|jgi:uroporphyrinogen decarboxylase|nr:uroporphyrinogen decarboxylase family protein [FCB group bacterium]
MTPRNRFLETLLFGKPDRVPFVPGAARESTLTRWHLQGLTLDQPYDAVIRDLIDAKRAEKGLRPADHGLRPHAIDLGVSFRMIPTFEEKVLEHRDGHYIVQDWMGAITEISDQYNYTYIREAKDFVTRKWHKFPVQNRDDWENMKWRFESKDPRRFPDDFDARCEALRKRDYPLVVSFNGPFWQLREFCGFEGLCMLMLEQPGFVLEMALFWRDFCSEILHEIFKYVAPDMIYLSEDMAYKAHPMISPDMTRHYCAPCYRQWNDQLRAAGVPLYAMDSDGCVDLLIPVWLECGINVIDPLEVAAHNDINTLRDAYGHKLAFRGGIDKRAIAAGGPALHAELERIRPVIQSGGYIPGCDHAAPPDVSWQDYQDYCLSLAQLTGWLD